MLKRTDIKDEKMINDLRVIASFDCGKWLCENCPFNTEIGNGCLSLEIKDMVERYEHGEEVIY